ncbi:alpha/beta hydrolase [Lactobacillus mulieris]|uniref:Alpha/beta hydrolase n=1 Tax=Lactobacillus mulieris TaxID=2508708 RepID=A0AAW5WZF6_9LACO|nr:alpha/beta hydrolase [Lactobacillus mulieris]MCZ3622411.1 alpha/beta hydrolase [Lactobacillus mulieris]MCZ3624036.1 alpha/beta hydrolase [Lactobacillus mulieris]MCZ3636406.1 alpha/beta hydrolase [Lactobacillus mulieris]MCZ3690469.1 alpha/beta hydrolase [Lactobacillus mulieris]MCZ3695956.1 alpha/beta hydrolase [Lactobacillus mulieris]
MKRLRLNKDNIWLVAALIVIIMTAIPTIIWMQKSNKDRAQRHNSQVSPVIMVPGSSATTERFNELVNLLNKNTQKKHSLLKVKVSTSGNLTYSGSIKNGDTEPIIVIGFQNNHDGYSNIKKQAGWLNVAFKSLSEQYKFNNFKAFGHSNGGLIWTYWLEHYYSNYSSQIKIKTLMTLGSPYNFTEKNINNKTQMLSDFIKYKSRLPKTLTVYSISGGENYESDGLVPENSVEAAKYVFQEQVAHFTAMTVTGSDAQHSSLPQNKQVVQVIQEYLLDKERNNNLQNRMNRKRTLLNRDNNR